MIFLPSKATFPAQLSNNFFEKLFVIIAYAEYED